MLKTCSDNLQIEGKQFYLWRQRLEWGCGGALREGGKIPDCWHIISNDWDYFHTEFVLLCK